ncbi:DUF4259 domain-containing protein [Kitasatospora sp. NPDC004669]|uniref:DUF4259 domain-containing protein n=1 Tax=Kitasatospora sp. NPDC004669 TaxID=3154555 RepID=UPI0033A3D9D8
MPSPAASPPSPTSSSRPRPDRPATTALSSPSEEETIGTRGVGPFANDSASNLTRKLDHAPSSERSAVLHTALARISDPAGASSYDIDEAIAAAALIASSSSGGPAIPAGSEPKKGIPLPSAELRQFAAQTLDRILAEANDHVGRWRDVGQGEAWLEKVEALRVVLDPSTPPTVSYTPLPVLPEHTQVGTRIVHQELGVDRFRSLAGAGTDTPLGLLVQQLRSNAVRMDEVQARLVVLAKSIQSDLQRIADGRDVDRPDTNGVLGSTAMSIDLLIARRFELHKSLTGLISTYRALAASQPPPTQTAPALAPQPQQPVKLTDAQVTALGHIAGGRVRMVEGGIRSIRRISAPGNVRISTATVDSLIDKRLVERDRSTSLFVGQDLHLTAEGRERYTALTASQRASAARTRSAKTAGSQPPNSSAVDPALVAAATPSAGKGR